MRPLLRSAHCANVCSCGLREREKARSRAPQNACSKSRLNWNMFPRSSAPLGAGGAHDRDDLLFHASVLSKRSLVPGRREQTRIPGQSTAR